MKDNNEIIVFENDSIKLDVNLKDETVWLTQKQIAKLFEKDRSVITKHINNVFEEELDRESNVQIMHIANSDKPVTFYNLDVIISVGYRVKSKNGIIFRRWANKVLKDYIIKGYSVNEKRLEFLEKKVKLLDIATRGRDRYTPSETKDILNVINEFDDALTLLDDYDHRTLNKVEGIISEQKITYEDCLGIIYTLKFNEKSDLFGLQRDKGLESIINNIYQTYDGLDIYKSVEEKAANFLYFIVKNHVFIDGNKRIAATLFIYFLFYYDILYKDDKKIIENNTLVALTLLIAESNPKEKNIIIDLIMNFLC